MPLRKNFLPTQHVRADVVPETLDEKKRTVEVVWTTGAKVKRSPWFGEPYYEELSLKPENIRMDFLNSGKAPFLAVHRQGDLDCVIGVVEKAWLTATDGRALIRFSEREDVEKIWLDVKGGILRGISVGYLVHRFERMPMAEGEEVPTYLAVDWEPKEISLVPVGADAGAGVRSEDGRGSECVLVNNVAERGEEEMEMPDNQKKVETPAPVSVDVEAEKRAAAAEERKRAAEIRKAVKTAKLDEAFAEHLINDGTELEKARSLIVDEWAKRNEIPVETRTQVRVEAGGQDEVETRRQGMEAALMNRFDPSKNELSELGRGFRSMSLLRMAEEVLGSKAKVLSRSEIAVRALSSSDFPIVLGNVARKTLRSGYEAQPQTFKPLVRIGSLPDYKEMSRVQFGDAPELLDVGENGEYKMGSIGEGAEKIKLGKKGRRVMITEETIVNDDLDAFTRIPAMFGAAAARAESNAVWAILTGSHVMSDGIELFHADHSNLAAAAAAIAEASLDIGTQALENQKSLDGNEFLNLLTAYLIVGPAKKTEAKKILNAQIVSTKSSDVNTFAGTMQLIVEPRITGKQWFLAASPSQIDTIELAYLDGMVGPQITTKEHFESDGVQIKIKHVFGVKAIDYRGFFKNSGA